MAKRKKEQKILLGKLSEKQAGTLARAIQEAQRAKALAERAAGRVSDLINMAWPVGANDFDLATGCFYNDPAKVPLANEPPEDVDSPEDETPT